MATQNFNLRGGRRGMAPTVQLMTPQTSQAQVLAGLLSSLQQQAPQMQRQAVRPQQQQTQQLRPAVARARPVTQAPSMALSKKPSEDSTPDRSSEGDVGFNPNAGPTTPGQMRALQAAFGLGLGAMGLGPIAAGMLRGIARDPGSPGGIAGETTSSALSSALEGAIPGAGIARLGLQQFGLDPVRAIANKVATSVRSVTVPKPALPTLATPMSPPATPALVDMTNAPEGWQELSEAEIGALMSTAERDTNYWGRGSGQGGRGGINGTNNSAGGHEGGLRGDSGGHLA